ncbi:MAG: hypothetical protein KGZ93_02280 [Actinobacteria bacterium]|nr:hypothetical protein [Actinomycetota bacterium]
MVFNPEDEQNFGPHCRNCHKGSSRCATCHNTSSTGAVTTSAAIAADNSTNKSLFTQAQTSAGHANLFAQSRGAADSTTIGYFKKSRKTEWTSDWRTTNTAFTAAMVAALCADDGFSWPHRTLGWKMLKDDLFGLNFDNNTWVGVGEGRFDGTTTYTAHDLDSVCLDCHNPNIWNSGQTAGSDGHVDAPPTLNFDDHYDELLTRGLP